MDEKELLLMNEESITFMNQFRDFNFPGVEEKWIGWIADKRCSRWAIILHHKKGTIQAHHPTDISKAIEKFVKKVNKYVDC